MPLPFWRKIYLVNPRAQGRAALLFSALFLAGGGLFGLLLHTHLHRTFLEASLRGHYAIGNTKEVLLDPLIWHVGALFVCVSLASAAVLRFLFWAIHRSVGRVIEAFGRSEEGDLSTPTDVAFLGEFRRFGRQVDAVRSATLEQIDGIRQETALLTCEEISPEEFRLHWDMLKQRIRRIAP